MTAQHLTPERVELMQQLFEQALALPEADRAAFLREHTHGQERLHDDVFALLHAHARADAEFSSPIRALSPSDFQDDEERWNGMRIGPWRVTRRIGFGGMGTVCEAIRADEQYHQQVAVKFLHHHAGGPGAIRRFKDERQILANLSHPNIATLIDGGVTDEGQPYIVMEYVNGQPITRWADERQLAVRDRVKLFLQVCAAVEAAHRNLVIHRDLKPGNILVTATGHVKLLDFGIARLLKTTREDGSQPLPATVAAFRSFTPDYAAPEQVLDGIVGTTADVYSLGVVLFELLSGHRPFDLESRSLMEIARTVCETPAPRPNVNEDLDAIILMALRKEPERRYGSVSLLAADLHSYLDGKPVSARPDGFGYRMRKLVGRHRVASIAAALTVIAVFTGTGVALWQAEVARRAAGDTALMNTFLLEVLQMSDPFDAGSELTLSQALDHAAASIDERFAGRPDLTAEIRFGIGYSMLSRYRLEPAEQQLLLALKESTAEFGNDDIRTLRVLDGVASLRQEQGRVDESQKLYERTIARLEATGQQSDALYVDTLGSLGNLHLTQERYPEADRLLQKARIADLARGGPLTLDRANLLSNLAHAAHGLENLDHADKLYGEAQQAYETLFPGGNPDLAILLNNRALLAEERHDNEAALALHKQSLAVRRHVFGAEHPMIVVALSNVARMSVVLEDRPLALSTAQDAAAMADRVYTTPHNRHAGAYGVLAEARLANNDIPGATSAWLHAEELLAKVGDAPPSSAQYLQRVHTAICERNPGAKDICMRKRS